MKSGSWASCQSALPPEARIGGEPDDGPILQTIPERPTPGERYMEGRPGHSWAVYDWINEGCECLGRTTGEDGYPRPDPACGKCQGTGDDRMLVPEMIADGLTANDARLLAFGRDAVDALTGLIGITKNASIGGVSLHGSNAVRQAEKLVRLVNG